MADVGVAMNKAEDKTEQMKAKAKALDEMIDSGVLTDYTSNKDDIEAELEKISVKGSVDQELAKLKAERAKRRKEAINTKETEEVKETGQDQQEQEQETETQISS